MRLTRRRILWGGAGLVAAMGGLRLALPIWARPGRMKEVGELSAGARRVVEESFADVELSQLWDVHTHVVGLGMGGTGCFANEAMQSHLHPVRRLQFDMYLAASGIVHREKTDAEFVERLLDLARLTNPKGRFMIMAFDQNVRLDGTEDRERSPFYVPNEYAARLCREHESFEFTASVHPYRKDALERLRRAQRAGAKAVKWLPNAMGIDPSSERCDAYYDEMKKLDLVLISHTGVEQAVHAEEAQKLGNPLLLRRPLERGLKVVAAHCATLGQSVDIESKERKSVPSLELFFRLMKEKRYEGLFFGDLSAITLQNRDPKTIRQLLLRRDIHHRLLNGSDYPVVAVDPVISLNRLSMAGLIDDQDIAPLREVFSANPLLFDYVLKRRLRHREAKRDYRFASLAFETRRVFERAS